VTYQQVIPTLLVGVPEFRETYNGLRSWAGEDVGANVVFGGLFDFVIDLCRGISVSPESNALLQRVLAFVEECASSQDPETQNLLQVSFMEHIRRNEPSHQYVVHLLGPYSLELLRLAESW